MKEKLTLSPIFMNRIEEPLMESYYTEDFVFTLMEDEEPGDDPGFVLGYLTAS
jgi:hypothetical protein